MKGRESTSKTGTEFGKRLTVTRWLKIVTKVARRVHAETGGAKAESIPDDKIL